jgi:hypothetical protein
MQHPETSKGVDWEALDKAKDRRFPPLLPAALNDEVQRRDAAIDAVNQLPGRMVSYMERWNGRKWVLWKERYITDEDWARVTKQRASRPAQPSDEPRIESDTPAIPGSAKKHPPPDGFGDCPTG